MSQLIVHKANTLKIIKDAIAHKVNMIEVDVRKTLDGQYVIFHDPFLGLSTNKKGFVIRSPWKEVKLARYKKTNEKILTLEEVIGLTKGKVKLLLDLKLVNVREVVSLLKKHKVLDDCVLASFYTQHLSELSQLDKSIQTGLFSFRSKDVVKRAKSLNVNYICSMYFSRKSILEAKKEHIKLISWPTNNIKKILKYTERQFDIIETDIKKLSRKITEFQKRIKH
jgi:glycerophosphoryl diester phosphodiesterase